MKITKYIAKYGVTKSLRILVNMLIKKYRIRTLKLSLNENSIYKILINNDPEYLNKIIFHNNDLGLKANIESIKADQIYNKESSTIIKEADNYCNNIFNILGSGWISWEKNGSMDWHTDRIYDCTWGKGLYYTDISNIIRSNIIRENSNNSDPKIPRELSRFHFLFSLFYAYIYTGQKIYLEKIKSTILDWISDNQPYYGINWSNAMEAAIRVSNWCLVVNELKRELLSDLEFAEKFYKSLAEHVSYINYNQENIIVKNNHYISNIIGLFIIHSIFPVFKKNEEHLKNLAQKLSRELKNQVYEDGGNVESSSAYHRFVTELFFMPFYVTKKLGLNLFNRQDSMRLINMFKFIKHILKPSGNIIQFGDNDSGRLIKLFDRPALDQSYMLSLGFGLSTNSNLSIKEFPFDILGCIFWGKEAKNHYENESNPIFQISSNAFNNSGVYILRNNSFFAGISAIPNGSGIHTHNDKLSFELTYRAYDIIVDPGTYVYSPDVYTRNKFRSTACHNTVMENGYEQNAFGLNVFELANDCRVTITKFDSNIFEAYHDGFINKGGHKHNRLFQLYDSGINIEDTIDSNELSSAFFHFAPNIQIDGKDTKFIVHANGHHLLNLVFDQVIDSSIDTYDYSPGYGELIKCNKLSVSFSKHLQTSFILN